MLGCPLGARTGTTVVPRDLWRFRLLEHGSEPGAEHRMRGKRAYDLRRFTTMPAGGHFAALEQPTR